MTIPDGKNLLLTQILEVPPCCLGSRLLQLRPKLSELSQQVFIVWNGHSQQEVFTVWNGHPVGGDNKGEGKIPDTADTPHRILIWGSVSNEERTDSALHVIRWCISISQKL